VEDDIAAALTSPSGAYVSLYDVSELVVTLTKEVLDQAEQIT